MSEGPEIVEPALTMPSQDPMRIWAVLARTDPNMTKGFKRTGGFQGTAIKPIYSLQRMTEQFGPCGTGWGTNKPEFRIEAIVDPPDVLVFCIIGLWYIDPGTGARSDLVYGVGGDRIVVRDKNGVRTNDDALKAAFTDALSNAMKHIGMSADIHLGLFEDHKYVRDLREEFSGQDRPPPAPPPPPPPQAPPTPNTDQVRQRLRDKDEAEKIRNQILTAQTEAEIDGALNSPEVDRFQRERPDIFAKLCEIADRARGNVPPF